MFRAIRARPQLVSRVIRRNAHVEYGPEQPLLTRGRIITAVVATGFVGLIWYDKFYAKHLKEGKSSVGDVIIPSSPTREEVFAHEDKWAQQALKDRAEMQLIFSADNTSSNDEENIRLYPVPVPVGVAMRPGQTMDLDKIEERRPRSVYFKKLDDQEKKE